MKTYKPVPDSFKEELEILSALKKLCTLKFRGDNGAVISLKTQLEGIYKDEDAEFLKTGSGLPIRLDQLVEVNGQTPENFC